MNSIIIITTVISLLCKFISGFTMLPHSNSQDKGSSNDMSYQSLHMLLQSIENRIQNLENTLSIQYTSLVEGKMDYYGRKIENIEKDVIRFEAHVRIEMDKLLENISNKNYKEDITIDRTVRKIDGVYERITHKLNSIEGQIDVTNVKSQNAQETILVKLDKIVENLSIRDGDLESEIADAVAAIDDLKTTCSNMEENIVNTTRDSLKGILKNGEKSSKKHFSQAINTLEDVTKNISVEVMQLHKSIKSTMNQSLDTYSKINKAKIDFEESINEYANKITDMYFDLRKQTDFIDVTVKNIAATTNITRIEQQNGLRALMVQVGRKTSKNPQSDTMDDNQKLTELIKKVDSNFENVMTTQNLFLESCHRVQMDESQLESQISIVLDKLIDAFENKTAVGPKDIKHLEHVIRNHDTNIRKSIYQITSHLLNLIQKNTDNKDEIVDYVKSQLLHLEALHMMIQNTINTKSNVQDTDILHELQILQQTIKKTQTPLDETNSMNIFITKMLNSTSINTTKLDELLKHVDNISAVLNSLERTISKSYFNRVVKYNLEIVGQQFEKQLNEYISCLVENNDTNTVPTKNTNKIFWNSTSITHMLLEIFNKTSNEPNRVKQMEINDTNNINFNILGNKEMNNTLQSSSSSRQNSDTNDQNNNLPQYIELSHTQYQALNTTINPVKPNTTQTCNNCYTNSNFNESTNTIEITHSDKTTEHIILYNSDPKVLNNISNFNVNLQFELLQQGNLNKIATPESNNGSETEESSLTPTDIEILFQTTEKIENLHSSEYDLIIHSDKTNLNSTTKDSLPANNLLSTIFDDDKNPD